jgi:rubredoxin
MKDLKNIDHTFDVEVGDVGCTIRKGTKWSEVPPDEHLTLWNCPHPHSGDCDPFECKHEGSGNVVGFWLGEFGKLPPSLVAIEHNKSARDMDVLREMMKVGYGKINDDDIVTALIYERKTN